MCWWTRLWRWPFCECAWPGRQWGGLCPAELLPSSPPSLLLLTCPEAPGAWDPGRGEVVRPASGSPPPACSWPAHCPGRWTFGDGNQVVGQFKPPYNESFQVPDPTVAQVLVGHNATHTYTIPGEGWPTDLLWGQSPSVWCGLMAWGPEQGEGGVSGVRGGLGR